MPRQGPARRGGGDEEFEDAERSQGGSGSGGCRHDDEEVVGNDEDARGDAGDVTLVSACMYMHMLSLHALLSLCHPCMHALCLSRVLA